MHHDFERQGRAHQDTLRANCKLCRATGIMARQQTATESRQWLSLGRASMVGTRRLACSVCGDTDGEPPMS